MARRNGRKGDWLVTDDYYGITCYASELRRDYWGAYAKKPLKRNLQEIASPLNDPAPVPFYRAPSYERYSICDIETAPATVGNTSVPTNTDNPAMQSAGLALSPGIGDATIGCTFMVG